MGENKHKEKGHSKHAASTVPVTSSVQPVAVNESLAVFDQRPPFTVIMECAMNGNVTSLTEYLELAPDLNEETVTALVNQRIREDGRCPLDWSAMLGNAEMILELLSRGSDINAVSDKGYSALHLAAAWGQMNCLKVLVEHGADLQLKNVYDERPRDIAGRYQKRPCAQYLDWTEARLAFKDYVQTTKDQFSPDKMKTLSKEEKATVTSLIAEKLDWLEKMSTDDVSLDQLTAEKQDFESILAPIINKLNELADSKSHKAVKKAK